MRTHYDNLKVAETATRDVIKSSYRKLCLQHHPDRNPDNADAQRIMQIINDAYDVLSDPVKRRAYDQELGRRREREASPQGRQHSSREAWRRQATEHWYQSPGPSGPRARPKAPFHSADWMGHGARTRRYEPPPPRNSRLMVTAGIAVLIMGTANYFYKSKATLPFEPRAPVESRAEGGGRGAAAAQAEPAFKKGQAYPRSMLLSLFPGSEKGRAKKAGYVRPAMAPNGQPWPGEASYVKGYPQAAIAGESRVTLDNTGSDDDVFVKLMSLRGGEPYAVRICFVPAHAAFTLMAISPGDYDLRFRNLNSGATWKTEAFALKEARGPRGLDYTTMRLVLSRKGSENLPSGEIADAEF